ncbi:SDR family NAD(P)-dependent oxidoreductase [Streptomyces nodosus]|nr:glucose 1-dehydrogenase [Streptomyces nodosus]MBB4789667.1 NAD(P)-dependent dehydrogenase (short-subunit alcohol dehydrogenase family) [Streptomyces nodosus]
MTADTSVAELGGKHAIVTGASRGIGAAISRALAGAGARVLLVGRSEETLARVAAELPNDPVVMAVDLTRPDAHQTVMNRAEEVFGTVDVLVNNAGGGGAHGPLHTVPLADADTSWDLYLRAPLFLSALAAMNMAGHGGGSIVNISSGLGQQGMAGTSVYSALRAGIEGATRALAAEWGAQQVRVNAVCPGVTRTTLGSWVTADAATFNRYLGKVPLGRIGEPEDIAAAVLFLSTARSSYITGQTLNVDGGWATSVPNPAAH